jgi:cytoskeletal protein CcmA (bactofilin family)
MPKKSEYSDIKESERVSTVLSESTAFNGVLVYETSLKIEGYFKGRISTRGHLIVGEKAKVYANIQANNIVIAGEVKGDIEALERLEMLPTAKLYGNIRTKKLKMADGVVFEGRCEMLGPVGRDVGVPGRNSAAAQAAGLVGAGGAGPGGMPLSPIIEEKNEEVVKTN